MYSRAAVTLRTVAPAARTRMIHASPVAAKTVTESVADAAKKVHIYFLPSLASVWTRADSRLVNVGGQSHWREARVRHRQSTRRDAEDEGDVRLC